MLITENTIKREIQAARKQAREYYKPKKIQYTEFSLLCTDANRVTLFTHYVEKGTNIQLNFSVAL